MTKVAILARCLTLAKIAWWQKGAVLASMAVLLLAAALRLWGLVVGSPVQHPDEVFLVIYPLNFLGGDLNPYSFHKPTLHFYLLGLVYLTRFALTSLSGSPWDFSQFVAYHYFWDNESLVLWARVVGVLFAVGTVWCVTRLARHLYGEASGLIAGLFLAISVLHVRQSPLAAVDVPMTFWFVCALWSSVRLCRNAKPTHYVLAGSLVGLAAGTKYPGAAAGLAVACAHFLAGRKPWDRRLWLSGVAAIGVFLLSTPYSMLDFSAFKAHFIFQAQHVQGGRGEEGSAWLYHLAVSLRHNIGVLGLLALPVAIALQVFRQRRTEVWVVLCGFTSFLIAIGWGQLAFMRYALPLVAIQVVLVSGLVTSITTAKWRIILVALIAAEPLYGSLRVAQLLGSTDTRTEAVTWIENNIPPGAVCCNFGGWAGDPAVRTFADHQWRMKTYARSFGDKHSYDQIEFLDTAKPQRPFFAYAVHPGNREVAAGDWNEVKNSGCSYVILHRHPLSYSTVDSTFAAQLPNYGEVVANWSPGSFDRANPVFDPADAYYVPVGNFGSLRQPGPQIEVWDIERFPTPPTHTQTGNSIFAEAYALWSSLELDEERLEEARKLISRAGDLDSNNVGVLIVTAKLFRKEKRAEEALAICQRIAKLRPDSYIAYEAMAVILDDIGAHEEAILAYRKSLALNPDRSVLYNNLAVAYRALGDHHQATDLWQRAIDLDPMYSMAHYSLGTHYYATGDFPRALFYLEQAAELQPDNAQVHNNAGSAARGAGEFEKAIQIWENAIESDPEYEDLYYNIALTLQADLRDFAKAIPYWLKVLESSPDDLDAVRHIVAAYAELGQSEQAAHWRSRLLSVAPDVPESRQIRQELDNTRSGAEQ